MPTRTRTRRPSAAPTEQTEFNPEVIASGISTGGERTDPDNPDDAAEDYGTTVQSPEIRGPHPDGDDDGSEGDYSPGDEVETVDETDAGEYDDGDPEEDPSASQPLGRTVAGMTQGQQAAQAELKDYMRRFQNLTDEMEELRADAKELKKEIKNKGYDLKAFALVFKLAGLDEGGKQKLYDQKDINQLYATAVGVDPDLV